MYMLSIMAIFLNEEVFLLETRASSHLVRILTQVIGGITITPGANDFKRTTPMSKATFSAERCKAYWGRLGNTEILKIRN